MTRDFLEGIDVFLAVAESRGFRSAAERLGVAPSAVSLAIKRLERRIGAPLFARTTRSVALTEAGEHLLEHARPAVELVRSGLESARGIGTEPRGTLRINAPRAALPFLVDRIASPFVLRNPHVRLELVGDDRAVDIVAEGFDAGVRFGHLVEKDMVTTRLAPPDRYVVVGAPTLVARVGRPIRPRDLLRLPCVVHRREGAEAVPWSFAERGRIVSVSVEGVLVSNDVDACRLAAERGIGFFRLARSLVADAVASETLVTVLDGHAIELPSLVLYYPSPSRALPKLRALVEFVKREADLRPRPTARGR